MLSTDLREKIKWIFFFSVYINKIYSRSSCVDSRTVWSYDALPLFDSTVLYRK